MSAENMLSRIVRYGDLVPCRTAFIDAHTPGSDRKENFTIIGGGVSESPDQHVHINETPGFNIGAAGQPPHCVNSLHTHRTAEVFFVLSGRWRFFWGRSGDAGEVILNECDLINIPTGIFRGFENVGTAYGMIMAVLGGDDAGGGVVWAPEVIEQARQHGLELGNNGILYNLKIGELLPEGIDPAPLLSDAELDAFPELPANRIVRDYVARYWDLIALSSQQALRVLGADGLLYDRPGFEIDFLSRGSAINEPLTSKRHDILMPVQGHWRFQWQDGETTLNPGDTCAVPPGVAHTLRPSMTGDAALYRVRNTDDPAGATCISGGVTRQ